MNLLISRLGWGAIMSKNRRELFSLSEREVLEKSLKAGKKIKECAVIIDRPTSSVYFEINRGGGKENYNAINAQKTIKRETFDRYDSHFYHTFKQALKDVFDEIGFSSLIDKISELKGLK